MTPYQEESALLDVRIY